jgi:hypothetical protein
VLVERTLSGEIGVPLALPFLSSDPITTDYGVPERDAVTSITAPDGSVYDGHEVSGCHGYPPPPGFPKCDGSGAGVYKFYLKGAAIVPQGKYLLRVTTKAGEIITAETTFPEATLAPPPTVTTFNRTTDTLELSWPDPSTGAAYQVRIENPNIGWSSFTDSTRVHLNGGLRNPDDPKLGRVFLPGFQQSLSVTAIDANLFDYYRTLNNSFVGYGTISRVKGAMGVFGSAVMIQQRTVRVTANQTLPIEGIWDAVDAGLGYVYYTQHLNLYVESAASKKGQADAITGNFYNTTPVSAATLVGTQLDGKLDLTLGSGFTGERVVLEVRGDTLIGSYSRGAPAKFIRHR